MTRFRCRIGRGLTPELPDTRSDRPSGPNGNPLGILCNTSADRQAMPTLPVAKVKIFASGLEA
jgi:hypothetical protein